jgi:hypothetical protein
MCQQYGGIVTGINPKRSSLNSFHTGRLQLTLADVINRGQAPGCCGDMLTNTCANRIIGA